MWFRGGVDFFRGVRGRASDLPPAARGCRVLTSARAGRPRPSPPCGERLGVGVAPLERSPPKWIPVRRKRARQNKGLEMSPDPTWSGAALASEAAGGSPDHPHLQLLHTRTGRSHMTPRRHSGSPQASPDPEGRARGVQSRAADSVKSGTTCVSGSRAPLRGPGMTGWCQRVSDRQIGICGRPATRGRRAEPRISRYLRTVGPGSQRAPANCLITASGAAGAGHRTRR